MRKARLCPGFFYRWGIKMSEITSSIRIEDGFSEPLKNLAKASWDVESAVTSVAKGLIEQQDYLKEVATEAKDAGIAFGTTLVGSIKQTSEAAKSFSQTMKENISNFDGVNSVKEMASAFKDLGMAAGESSVETVAAWRRMMNAIATIRKLPLNIVNSVSMSAFHKLKDSYIKGFNALMASLDKSMDEINVTDKLNAMWGDAGNVARKRAYELANELGESATTVSNLAANAAYEGIGTDDFERMMRLADKVSKLKPGESTESVANSLIQNIKSGHDASSIAQMFGGGQQMERQLRRSGYERALNRGDVEGALKIAEEIAEQAGLTDEKYKGATNNLSQNYKKIQNTIDNVQRRLAETFNRTFAPTVQKIKELLESDKFKTFVKIADYIVDKLGKFLNWFAESAVDNIHVIGVMLGVGIVTKIMLIVPKIAFIFKMLALSKGPLGFILRTLGGVVGKLITIIAKQGILKAMSLVGPWVAVAAAVSGITYGIYKLSGATMGFWDWLKGIGAALVKFGQNLFTNIFIFFDRVVGFIMEIPSLASAAFRDVVEELEELKKKLKGEEIEYRSYIDAKDLKKMTEEERKALGALRTETVRLTEEEIKQLSTNAGAHALADKYDYISNDNGIWFANRSYTVSDKRQSHVDEALKKLEENQMQYIDNSEGLLEAYNSGTTGLIDSITNWAKKLVGLGEEQLEAQGKIETDTGKIRRMGEQEEELRWLKAFSDRQIMSAYNNSTTISRTLNQYGVSDTSKAESARSFRTMPARAV